MKKIDIRYFDRSSGEKKFCHSYTEKWEKLELFCPKCGEQDVWHEMGTGDYYEGGLHLCAACNSGFYLPSISDHSDNEQCGQRLEFLKEGE